MQVANEWMEKIEEIAVSYGWTLAEHRQAASTRLGRCKNRGILSYLGCRRQCFLAAFGRTLTMDHFVKLARGRVRAPKESLAVPKAAFGSPSFA